MQKLNSIQINFIKKSADRARNHTVNKIYNWEHNLQENTLGVGIEIRKYKEGNGTFFYKLYSLDGKQVAIYMKIDSTNCIVTYSRCPEFSYVDSEIDINDENAIVISITNVDYYIISRGISRATKALKSNSFPESMDYISG